MGYRDDFYIQANIIGYTGNPNHAPTVYFLRGPVHGPHEYGHITQAHNLFANVGREAVGQAGLYEMRTGVGGVLEEWADGDRIHESRNAFVAVSPATLDALAAAIPRYPNKKRIGEFDLGRYFDAAEKSDREGGRRFSF